MRSSGAGAQRGAKVAAAHAGLWRDQPPPLALDEAALEEIAPLCLSSGSAPLLSRRLEGTPLALAPVAAPLRATLRYQLLQAEVQARDLACAIERLAEVGIVPLLTRGFAAASLYPAPELRPYVDHDLAVRPHELARAERALSSGEWRVDLHAGFAELDDRPLESLHERSRALPLGSIELRVLGPEDHLRQMCLHLTRHGGWRPLWLCDVACAVEREPLDWELLATGDPHRTREVACVLALARDLLGAKDTPLAARTPPPWLARTLLGEWGKRARFAEPLLSYLRRPLALPLAIRDHFPNPIAASAELRAPFDDRPRARYQLEAAVKRARKLL